MVDTNSSKRLTVGLYLTSVATVLFGVALPTKLASGFLTSRLRLLLPGPHGLIFGARYVHQKTFFTAIRIASSANPLALNWVATSDSGRWKPKATRYASPARKCMRSYH